MTDTRVDFYQLGAGDRAEAALPLIARNTLNAGERLLIVSADADQLGRIGNALWSHGPGSFLAHGLAGEGNEARQPILLSDETAAANGARFMAIADGSWRETESVFVRTFFMFDETTLQAARDCWRMLGTREGIERRFWKREQGRWREGP